MYLHQRGQTWWTQNRRPFQNWTYQRQERCCPREHTLVQCSPTEGKTSMSLYNISRGFHTWGYVSGGWPWSYSGNDQDGSWPGAAEFARQYSKPQIFQAPASLITIASGEMFLWSILALSWRKARPSDTWRSPYLISISNILCERSCSGTGLGSWSWRRFSRFKKHYEINLAAKNVGQTGKDRFGSKGKAVPALLQRMLNCQDPGVSQPGQLPNSFLHHLPDQLPIPLLKSVQESSFQDKYRSSLFCRLLHCTVNLPKEISQKEPKNVLTATFHRSPGPPLAMWAVTSKSLNMEFNFQGIMAW